MEKISYVCNHRNYTFRGQCIYPAPGQNDFGKRIYRGNFLGQNPCPGEIFPDQEYILVQITVDSSINQPSGLPQCRQYWDAAEFEGDHLRRILSRNDAAQILAAELKENRAPSKGVYQMIEPVYLPSAPYIHQMSAYEKLDLAFQGCLSLEEFCSFHFPSRILCHRDFKLANLMIEPLVDSFRARLIDYASLCRAGGDGTIHDAVSQGNTAPEVLGLEDTGFRVCDRTDVFALAGILGELFGSCNPIALWSQDYWPTCSDDRVQHMNLLRAAYKSALQKYPYHPGQISWLEQSLKGRSFRWKDGLPQDLMEKLISLFRQMIPIDPRNRISMEEAREGLESLLRAMESRNLAFRSCSGLYLRNTTLLFDRRLLSRHRSSYLPALDNLCKTARKQAEKANFAGIRLTFLAYGLADQVVKSAIEQECFMSDASGVQQIMAELRDVPDTSRGCYSLLPQALTLAGRQSSHCFSTDPSIHIFAPDDMMECPGREDLSQAAAKLSKVHGCNLILHSVKAEGTGHWYSYHDKLSPPSRLWDTTVSREDTDYAPPHKIDDGPDAWFILREGRKIYAGRKV